MNDSAAFILSVYKNDSLNDLKECLVSLYDQTLPCDICIQKDGPVRDEIDTYLQGELSSGKVHHLGDRETNKGLAYSLNELVDHCLAMGYKYLLRMDADDISLPNRAKLQIDFMDKNPDVDIVGGLIREFNVDTGEEQEVHYFVEHDEIKTSMRKRNSMAHVTVCYRESYFGKSGKYDQEKLNEDYDMWIRGFLSNCRFMNIPEVLVKVRTSNDFFLRRKNPKRAVEVMKLKMFATKQLGLAWDGYLYAMAHYLLFMSPGWMKLLIYKRMRK
jgi:GT2 family glycosyltransferase